MTVEELKAVLVSMGVDEALIIPDAVREEVGLDSLGIAELALVMHQEKGIPVTEEELHGAVTVTDVVALLDRLATRAGVHTPGGTARDGSVPVRGTHARTAGTGGAA
ncbi:MULTISPECIES: acyl carrier protein [unclassified Streptomyces]|uniref:acyl carrier protein n=1 Tax=unclassified Streptomyces TaxID=2593676 RepID=UPI002DD8F620|nr:MULTISPECIES: acyl carrier protein [unclassified Streptomyces]WSA93812.1 acyl carrier protein [Streptomyces sp. NBC_01795]WSB78182.1 acyl carrier protein [Streptomyces sp. NBC_01775]WSS13566.1 acyl carrier protein [Streptomyces sp. NBC_01186]WSS42361.1 acyl carrier protein [Streptomyces sp. NBC_01187]